MTRNELLMTPKKQTAMPLILGLLMGGGILSYGLVRWNEPSRDARSIEGAAARINPKPEAGAPQKAPGPAPSMAPAPVNSKESPVEPAAEAAHAVANNEKPKEGEKGKEGKEGKEAEKGDHKDPVMLKLEPLVANLDEGDQLRYLKLSIQIEIVGEAEPKARAALPRARHEALMYMSGLHLTDTQGLLGKQRIHRELQRRIADAIGGGVKRIYFDEFVVQ